MSFTSKLLSSSSRMWQSVTGSRGFHMLMRPISCGGGETSYTSVASTPGSQSLGQLTQNGALQTLLTPFCALITQVAGFKVKGRLKRRCKDCYFVVRQERAYVICPTHPRHKQMAMKKRDYKSWILTHATQSPERGY